MVVAAMTPHQRNGRIPTARLTDTQLVILSSASRRNDRGVDLPGNVAAPIGSSTRCAAFSLAWCAKSSALNCVRRNPVAVSGSIASSMAAVFAPNPAARAAAPVERPCHAW